MKSTILLQAAFAALASTHFTLDYPKVRDFDEDKLSQFPCGSFNTPSANRTLWPLSGGSILLNMGHVSSKVEVLIGFGNDPGSAFNTVLRQTFQETGFDAFCMTGFTLPSGVDVKEGTNATIQVITNGDPDGGLYNCADITFSKAAPGPETGKCTNSTGVTASSTTISGNANETTSTTPTTSDPATSSKPGAAASLKVSVAGFVVAAGVAFAIAL